MNILRIEHPVPSYDGWKKAFDSDPINRKRSGVKRYRIFQPTDDGARVIVDLEFDNLQDAQDTLAALRKLWDKVAGTVMNNLEARILDVVESMEL